MIDFDQFRYNYLNQLFKRKSGYHIETSKLTCLQINWLVSIWATLAFNELNTGWGIRWKMMSILTIFEYLWKHSHKKRKDSLKTRTEPVVLRSYLENQAILEPILLYRA